MNRTVILPTNNAIERCPIRPMKSTGKIRWFLAGIALGHLAPHIVYAIGTLTGAFTQ